jgi:holliday junction DNA helicase RuvA
MIASLTGIVSEKLPDLLVIDIGGVGYGVWVSQEDWMHLNIGVDAKLYIYENIKEQNHDLFGFSSYGGKTLFEKLLNVSGVGPKMALSVLNVGPIEDVKSAIAEGNVKLLQAANGVGKKVAERIVVDLKDKVGLQSATDATTFLTNPVTNRFDEAQEALVSLGFSAHDAAIALSNVDADLSTEERVKLALKARNSI